MRRLLILVLLPALLGCFTGLEQKPRVLMIGLEGVSWDLVHAMVKAGEAPNFARLQREGAWGVLESEEPIISAGLWVTIATGRTDADHHVIEPIRYDKAHNQLVTPERAVSTIWEILARNDVPAGVIGWPGSAPVPPWVKVRFDDLALYRGLGAGTALGGDALPVPELTGDEPGFALRKPPGGDITTRIAMAALTQVPQTARETWPQVRFLAVYLDGLNTPRHYAGMLPLSGVDRPRPEFGKVSRAYIRRLDQALGELLDLADSQTLVLVASRDATAGRLTADNDRFFHAIRGVAAVLGPGVAAGRRMENPTVLDFVPAALTYLGLPLSEQMAGNAFPEAWRELPRPRPKVASHDVFIRRPYPEEAPLHDDDLVARVRRMRETSRTGGRPFNARNRYVLDLLAGGQLQGAVTEALKDLRHDAQNPVSQYALGEVRLNRGEVDEGLINLRLAAQALGDRPSRDLEREIRVTVSLAIAEALMAKGDTAAARQSLKPALALCRQCPDAIALLATTHLKSNDPVRAVAVAETALRQDPDQPALWFVLGRARQAKGDLAGAQEALTEALARDPERSRDIHRELGLVLIARDQWREAAEHLRQATATDPNDAYAWFQMAQAYRQLGEDGGEEAALIACLRADGTYQEAWRAWRQLARRQGEHDKADRILASARAAAADQLLAF